MELEEIKRSIANNFGSAAEYYEQHADLQKNIAERLIASLKPWQDIIPSGPIIEIGCGTGFVTEGLQKFYAGRDIKAIDISDGMIKFCREKFSDSSNISFEVADAEDITAGEPSYAMTVSGFSAHWFKDPAQTLLQWLEATKPGGLLLASFPGNESFPEWRRYCRELGLPFTGNTYPDVEEMVVKMSLGPSQVDYYEDTVVQEFKNAAQFFEQQKNIGATTQIEGRELTDKEYSLLVDHWNDSTGGTIQVSHHIVFLAVKRDYNS